MKRVMAWLLVGALAACSVSVTPDAQAAPPPQRVVVVQPPLAQRDTVVVQRVREETRRPGRLKQLVRVGAVVLAAYGARELGQKRLKWNRNTAGQKVFPFVEGK